MAPRMREQRALDQPIATSPFASTPEGDGRGRNGNSSMQAGVSRNGYAEPTPSWPFHDTIRTVGVNCHRRDSGSVMG